MIARRRRQEKFALEGTVAAVTGGARGIGRATATALARAGARVSIGDLDAALAERTAAEIGSGTLAFDLDVTDRDSFARFLARTEEALGPLGVLVNNAGLMPVTRFVDEDPAVEATQIDVNLRGVILGTRLALHGMLARRRGTIVNIASIAGKLPIGGVATYCATKHAVVGLTHAVRAELQDSGVELVCVLPSMVSTELTAGVKPGRGVTPVTPEDVAEGVLDGIRFARPEVYVPSWIGLLVRLPYVLPPFMVDLIARAMKGDRLLTDLDPAGRAAYDRRIAAVAEETQGEPVEPGQVSSAATS